ncbi:uncharacterized protein LOC6566451 [Drosophila grimshawi]|uniref:GH13260 n=1 Tax=Drosophila grimshawi TaxID=7222 RepID=B4JQ64_DROGR|nr:uncharacterized protein LOC6566451 [Drosophila grimshawi]EDV99044.1 GH13260 [Drosophila grimshawi]
MCSKLLVVCALIAFVCLPLANSLTCYTCTGPADCKNPRTHTCSDATANLTSNYLRVHHQFVPELKSTSYNCLGLDYIYATNNSVVHKVYGCVHPNAQACSLYLKPEYSSWRKSKCNTCSGNNCNKSPAGKMSSSVFTIAATALAVMLSKIYA